MSCTQYSLSCRIFLQVLAGLLNLTDRADWRSCKLSKEDEIKMAEGFKKRFEEFDLTN
uniref:Cwf19-like protein C-terminal domain-containing protein n=1 Tax=Nelumbo nucifera TaxID=4432 RepID=A0A822ZH08_NELNU|nr:TPA_asm: hypothetical protein HUJ06_002652 [Nelumbo nucifera]